MPLYVGLNLFVQIHTNWEFVAPDGRAGHGALNLHECGAPLPGALCGFSPLYHLSYCILFFHVFLLEGNSICVMNTILD